MTSLEALRYQQELKKLKEFSKCDFVGLALTHGVNRKLLTWSYATGERNNQYQRIVLAPGKGIAGMVYQSRETLVIEYVSKEVPQDEITDFPILISEQIESLCAFPLWKNDTVEGVLMIAFRTPNQISIDSFERLMDYLNEGLCGYDIEYSDFGESLQHIYKQVNPEQVPVYELLTYHIIKAQEDERRKISRELHDGIVQELFSLQMLLRAAKYQKDWGSVLNIVKEADEGLSKIQDELRNTAVGLRPVTLDDLGLAAACRSHFDWISENYGIHVNFRENLHNIRFNMEQETVFYRVCQEALQNACKYSGCDQLSVILNYNKGRLLLKVIDHGKGFDTNSPSVQGSGIGLPSMMERADLIDGDLTIRSTPGEGTVVCLTADIQEATEGIF